MQCSPVRQGLGKSCLTLAELQSVASLYNQEGSSTHVHDAIPLHAFTNRESLLVELQKRFKDTCGDKGDSCWVEHTLVKSSNELYSALQKNYKPRKPSSWQNNDREWLNTFDILRVMTQYQEKHSHFAFLGVFPVDFALKHKGSKGNQNSNSSQNNESAYCIVQNMCNFNLQDLINNSKTSFGIILNLDRHDQPGSHWVALYCCWDPTSKKYGICYYDSTGHKPPKAVATFMKTVIAQEKEISHVLHVLPRPTFQTKYNCDKHQFQGTECGVFSLLFVILCLQKTKLKYRDVRNMIKKKSDKGDHGIHKYRKVFYRDES